MVNAQLLKIRKIYEEKLRPWSFYNSSANPEQASSSIQGSLSAKEAKHLAENPTVRDSGVCSGQIVVEANGSTGCLQIHYIDQANANGHSSGESPTKKHCPSGCTSHQFPASETYYERLMNHPDKKIRDLISTAVSVIHNTRKPLLDSFANHRSLGEHDPNWRLKVIALPINAVKAIANDAVVDLIINCPYPYWHVSELMEIMYNAKGVKRDLTFMRGAWRVTTDNAPRQVTTGKCIILDKRNVPKNAKRVNHFKTLVVCSEISPVEAYVFDGIPSKYAPARKGASKPTAIEQTGVIAICADHGFRNLKSPEDWINRLLDTNENRVPEQERRDGLKVLTKVCTFFGMATFASMLQKLIRYKSAHIRCITNCNAVDPFGFGVIPDEVFEGSVLIDTRIAIIFCMQRILDSPGQFVPNIQRFVRGPEKLAKRLAVIAFEDSDPTDENMANMLVTLLGAALLSQRIPLWYPSVRIVENWMRTALMLWKLPCAIDYHQATNLSPIVLENATTPLMCCAALLRIIKSFAGDENMMDFIAHAHANKTIKRLKCSGLQMPPMPFPLHVLDQHTHPNIALLLDPKGSSPSASSATPYANILRDLFEGVAGRNPRRDPTAPGMENQPYVISARVAQLQLLYLIQPPENIQSVPLNTVNSRTIPIGVSKEWIGSWFAAMVGHIDVGRVNSTSMVVTLDPNDVTHFIPTLKPVSRGQTAEKADSVLSDPNALKKSVEMARSIMSTGTIRLNGIHRLHLPEPFRFLHDRSVKLVAMKDNGEYPAPHECYVIQIGTTSNPNWTQWSTLMDKLTITIPLLDQPVSSVCGLANGETHDAEAKIRELCARTNTFVLQRVLYYITHFRPYFRMNAVSRDGGTLMGSYNLSVSEHDYGAFQWLLCASRIVPNALRYCNRPPFSFNVADVFALYRWRSVVKDEMQQQQGHSFIASTMSVSGSSSASRWPVLQDRLHRTLMDYQQAAVKRMLHSHQMKRSAHFLNVRVGLGKTLILLTYLQQRGLTDVKHIIYTMPLTAFSGVLRELVEMGLSVDIVTGSATTAKKGNSANSEWTKVGERHSSTRGNIRVVSSVSNVKPFRVIVVSHDALRLSTVKPDLLHLVNKSILVIDEVHKCMYSGTQRTSTAMELTRAACETIAMTGTPVLNAGSGKLLIPYLELVVPFCVGSQNFLVASNAMVAFRVDTGVGRKEITVDPWTNNQDARQKQHNAILASQQHGALLTAVNLCYAACTPQMVHETINRLHEGVLLVAKDRTHQKELAHALMNESATLRLFVMASNDDGLPSNSTVTYGNDIHLTAKTVRESTEESFHVVLVRQDQCEGYTVTALGAMVTSVYFSNQATREQMRGRIDRLTQHRLASKGLYVEYVTVKCGILKNVSANYAKAGLLSQAMSGKNVSNKDLQQLLQLRKM